MYFQILFLLSPMYTFLKLVSAACNENCSVFPQADFHDKQVNDFILWSNRTTGSYAACVSKCLFDFRCMMAGYSPLSGECRGYAIRFSTLDGVSYDVSMGARMFTMCRAEHFIGSPCSSLSDCHVPNSLCYGGQCTCIMGYSFSLSSLDRCVPDCVEYGSTLLKYDGKTVRLNNDRTVSGVTEEGCKQACIQETGILCKSCEYDKPNSVCNLMKNSWLGVASWTQNSNPDWSFFTRNCLLP